MDAGSVNKRELGVGRRATANAQALAAMLITAREPPASGK